MATFTTNQVGGNSNYMKYLYGSLTKTDKVNSPDLLDFSLVNYDGSMVKLQRGSHIVLTTSTYGVWYTGYITNDPEPVYLGTVKNIPQWVYTYEASGEEYMLNLKPFGIMAPFTNTTQGAIIKALINHLTPAGVSIDVSGIQNGQTVPRFIVDPNQHFSTIVDQFAKAANFQFRCKNFVATYAQQDTTGVGISVDGNSIHFTPSQLQMKASSDPIINDSIILGAIEPQNYMQEYFMGDGATATFPLISSVFGLDSTVLLDDDMSSSSIDSSKWTIFDTSSAFLQPFGGTLNVLGGSNNGSLDVSLQSASLIPLEGNLSCTHGEWDFVSASDGVLGGLWTGATNGSYTGLLFGIKATASGSSTALHPIVGSTVFTGSSVPVDYTKRYVMRTLYNFAEQKRVLPGSSYRDASGVIHQITNTPPSDHFYATTIITEIDPITALMTNQWTWNNDIGAHSNIAANYVLVASNNLNLTVSSVTISVPLQAALTTQKAGTSGWVAQIIGPNQIDALDGLAPAATIVDSNNGATTRNSFLGSPNYNPGQATLTYFKETALLISYLPQPGDLIQLNYRQAGAAVGRAQSKASIATESAAWGDDGVRSETKSDYSPPPQTSAECEMAATARVNDNSYQHWTGTYTMPSGSWFTGEPTSGTILSFVNLPSGFPSVVSAEAVNQVVTTFLVTRPIEQFSHAISFGPTSTIENVLAAVKNTAGVFTPQDTAEVPQFIDVTALGLTTVAKVPAIAYTGQDATHWNFAFLDTFPTGVTGVELRYTDNTWGADNGNNLIARIPSSATTFTIPRTVRGKVAFMRCYDSRNQLQYSEDLTQSAWQKSSPTTITQVMAKNPDNETSLVSKVVFTNTSDQVYQANIPAASKQGTFSVSVLGTAGQQVNIKTEVIGGTQGTSNIVTLTGRWQRISAVSQSFSSGAVGNFVTAIRPITSAQTVYVTRASLELSTSAETLYCKTNATAYGATSRFSTGIHTGLPMIPPSPTATGDFSRIDAPVISAILPANLTDVWGVEIRAADNMTVLYNTALVNATLTPPTVTGDTSMVLEVTAPALSRRAYSYWLYTFNLFGEYSSGYNFAATLNPPSVSNLNMINSEKMFAWTGSNATAYEVYVDKTDMTLTDLSVSTATINTFYPLADADFFALRYIAITPYDALGPGDTLGGFFEYLPDALTELTSTEVKSA